MKNLTKAEEKYNLINENLKEYSRKIFYFTRK